MNTTVKRKPKGAAKPDDFKIFQPADRDAAESQVAEAESQSRGDAEHDGGIAEPDQTDAPQETPDVPPEESELDRLRMESRYYDDWRVKVNALVNRIDAAKSEGKHWSGVRRELETDLRDLLLKGPETMHGRPLLDVIERSEPDPELWRQTPIGELSLSLSLYKKTAEHFQNAGQLTDWLNTVPREKKNGLGKKAVEQLEEAVNMLHEPLVREQLENAEHRVQGSERATNASGKQEEPEDTVFDEDGNVDDDWTWTKDDESFDTDNENESDRP